MRRLDTVLAFCGVLVLLACFQQAGIPYASAQSQQQIDEMCRELREMDAELAQTDDPQMRQMMEQQFARMRQQCAPGFAQKRSAQTPPATVAMHGRYRLVVEQYRQIIRQMPGASFNINDVHHAQAEFVVTPNQREFAGQGSIRYVSATGSFMAGDCQGRMSVTPVTHPANVNARMNQDGQSVFIYIDDMNTGGSDNNLHLETSCPDQNASLMKGMMPEDGVFIKSLPLRHGAKITEVSESAGIRNTVTATLLKL